MARLSDIIEAFIKDMLDEGGDAIQIQRNELANHFSCAPSQINYVLTTRFTTDKGYVIESRRGGGGCIVIKQIQYNDNRKIIDMLTDKIGDSITYNAAQDIVDWLYQSKLITEREGIIMKLAVNDRTLNYTYDKNRQRADLMKAMIMSIYK